MMKNTKMMALVALLAVLAGLIGLIVCVVPGQTPADKAVSQYVAAINQANTEKMFKLSAASVLSDALGNLGGSLEDLFDGSQELSGDDKIYAALQSSVFDAAGKLPEDAGKIKSVKVVGCVDGERESYMSLTGMSVTVILEVLYEDAEGHTQSLYSSENIGLLLYKNKYYLAG